MPSYVPQLVALDIGRSAVKAKSAQKEFLIESYIADGIELRLHKTGPGEYILEYPGQNKMFLGNLAHPDYGQGENSRKPMYLEKHHPDNLWLGLAALYEAGIRNGAVEIAIPIPYNRWLEDKDQIKALFEGEHRFVMNGEECRIFIDRVHLRLECAIAVYLLPEEAADQVVHILEVGERTSSWATFNPGFILNERFSGTVDQGWGTIANKDPKSVVNFLNARAMTGWKPDDLVMVIGGVAEEIAPHLPFKNLVVPEKPRFANCRGIWEAVLTDEEAE